MLVTRDDRLTHDVEVNAVIDKVVLPWLDMLWRRPVDTVFLAHCAHGIVRACEPDHVRVEVRKIGLEHGRGVTVRIAGDDYGSQDVATFRVDCVDHLGHLVELIWADVGAVREAEVELRVGVSR